MIKVIWITEGRPRFAASNVASERFGRYAVSRGIVKAEELAHVQELANQEKVRTGEAMVRLGLLTADQRVQLLHDQAQQILWSTFDWRDGTYRFVGSAAERTDYVPLQLPLAPLVLQGMLTLPLAHFRCNVVRQQVLPSIVTKRCRTSGTTSSQCKVSPTFRRSKNARQ